MRKLLTLFLCIGLIFSHLIAQNRTITGKITDENGKPVPNATIIVKGTKKGTQTGNDGSFTLTVSPTSKKLIVSSLNFFDQEIDITGSGPLQIALNSSTRKLDEVVVVGYGTQKKSQTVAALANVGSEKVENKPMTSVDKMLQGAVAGLQSTSSTGQPGSNQAIRVRGVGSFLYGGSQPLIIIDGIQINSGDAANGNGVTTSGTGGFNINPSTNVLATLNSDDIENISILKDAAATSIYGSRGANGVIIVTTKSGKLGKAQFRFDAESGVNDPILPPTMGRPLRSPEWLDLLKEGLTNANYNAATITSTLHSYGDTSNINTDWLGLITRKGIQNQYNLSVSGGQDRLKYFLSGGYFKQEGTTIETDLQRVTGNIKVTYAASDRLNLTTRINVGSVQQNSALASSGTSGGGGYFGNPTYVAMVLRPTQNPYNSDGSFNISTANNLGFPSHYNPMYIAAKDKRWLKALNGLVGQSLEYKIAAPLKFTSNIGLQYITDEEYQYNNPFHGDASGSAGEGIAVYTRNFLWDWTNQFDYHLEINKEKRFFVDVKAGHESIKNSFFQQIGDVTGFPPNTDLFYSTNAGTSTNGKISGSNYTFEGYFSNANFSYDNRFNLYGSFRRDASSRFSSNNRWGNFASIGASWVMSNESFFTEASLNKVISNLKIRGSYGNNGNAEIPNYAWRQQFSYGYNYNGIAGGRFDNVGNTNLTWEKNKQLDLGIDIGFLKNRINIIADYYKRTTEDALLSQQISRTTGFTGFINNIGSLENKGIEITLNLIPIKTKDFSWEIGINYTHNKNAVTKLPAGDQYNPQNSNFFLRKGHSIYEFYNRGWAGVNPADGTPTWYTDSTKSATTGSRANASLFLTGKNADPKYYGGLTNTFTFKNFTFSFDLYYNYGNYFQEAYALYFLDGAYPTRGKYTLNLQRWQKAGDITNVPKYVYGASSTWAGGSDRTLFRGDYIRLRNVQLGYKLHDKALLDKLHLTALSLYLRGTNLWTKTYDANLLSDPEQGVLGINQQAVMPSKSFTVGINVSF